jgi:anti-sigma regulatory factor (Ser/Thr protein kinase)
MLGGAAPGDDVALLAFQRTVGAHEALRLRVATRAEELAAIRRLLRTWLADAGADRPTISAVLLASGEACSNAMEHAYGPSDATFELAATREGDDVVVTVTDTGRWRPARGQNRGRGLRLMETFMDDVDVVPGDAGTTVRLRRRLTTA